MMGMRARGETPGAPGVLWQAIDGAPGLGYAALRGALRALSGLYWLGLTIDLGRHGAHLARAERLPARVISVGNLSVGGTGKTLATMKLARELSAAGTRVAVLSRGYRRASREPMAVVSTPTEVRLSTAEAGDEPCLLATSLPGVPVLVGVDRRRSGRHAITEFGAEVLILDDGFQYWSLHKDREIVLVDAFQPASRDHLLPRGLLREPWSHLRRAHEVWITHAQLAPPERVARLAQQVARAAPHAALRYTEHRPLHLRAPGGGTEPVEMLRGRRVLALSGLGNPGQFEAMLAALGAEVTPQRYPDHYPFSAADIRAIAAAVDAETLVVTTAKDAVRLPAEVPFPAWVIEVELAEVEVARA